MIEWGQKLPETHTATLLTGLAVLALLVLSKRFIPRLPPLVPAFFAALVGVMTYLGYLADQEWGTKPWLTITGGMLGVAMATFDLIRTVQRIERRDQDRKRDP